MYGADVFSVLRRVKLKDEFLVFLGRLPNSLGRFG